MPIQSWADRAKRWRLGVIVASALATAGTGAPLAAHAQWVIPAGSSADLAGGTTRLGCADLRNQGRLSANGGSVLDAKDIEVVAGAQWLLDSGHVELSQQWGNQGTVTVTTGQVIRIASPGCPLVGQAGPVALTAGSAATPVAVPALGTASLTALSALLMLLVALGQRRACVFFSRNGSNRTIS